MPWVCAAADKAGVALSSNAPVSDPCPSASVEVGEKPVASAGRATEATNACGRYGNVRWRVTELGRQQFVFASGSC